MDRREMLKATAAAPVASATTQASPSPVTPSTRLRVGVMRANKPTAFDKTRPDVGVEFTHTPESLSKVAFDPVVTPIYVTDDWLHGPDTPPRHHPQVAGEVKSLTFAKGWLTAEITLTPDAARKVLTRTHRVRPAAVPGRTSTDDPVAAKPPRILYLALVPQIDAFWTEDEPTPTEVPE